MTLVQLQYVLAVATYRSFTLAAEKRFVTQPTLSMQIQKLEEELGVLLFDRSQKPIGLTEVGQKIVAQAQRIVTEAERIKDIVDRDQGCIEGDYRLGIIPTVTPTLLPMFLNVFVKKYPKVNLIIEEQPTDVLVDHILEGHVNAGIAATPLAAEELIERPLYYEPFVGYVPRQHHLFKEQMLTPEHLEVDDMLLLRDGHCFRNSVINLCQSPKKLRKDSFTIESGSFETLISLVDTGMGMTLLPYLNTLSLNAAKKQYLKPFKPPSPAREISLIYHRSELRLQVTEALREVISAIVRGAIAFEEVEIVSPLVR